MSDLTGERQQGGRFRRILTRLTATQADLRAAEERQQAEATGCTPIAEVADRALVSVAGTVRAVTLRPRAGVPALEAELFDGTDALDVVWLGRRSITGIEPGRKLIAYGRVSYHRGRRVLFNPRYELRPVGHGSE